MTNLELRAAQALKNAQKEEAYQGIMNCVAAHLYSYRAQGQQNEIDVYWSKRHDEISYWDNNGYDAIKDFFVITNGENMRKRKLELIHSFHPEVEVCKENEGMGDMVAKGASTPYIVIAEDGQSAKGIWMTPGNCTEVGLDCRPKVAHMQEKLGIVAVKDEDGVWRILKLRTYVEFVTQLPSELLEAEGTPRTFDLSKAPADGKKPLMPSAYSIFTKAGYYPPMPEAYESWSEETAMVKLPTA
jgi:hypothetical protein